jgi:solute carrier family 45 protein 1/2/4
MASRVLGVGNIIGYIAGYSDLPKHVWWLGHTQFQILCAIASIALGSTVMISIGTIRERDARLQAPPIQGKGGILSFFKQVFTSIRRLPPQTRKVCEVEFFAWIGFFPQLFYSSSYIGDIYVQPYLEANPNMTPEEIDALYENATRVGTFALLVYAITSLSTNVLLPFLIAPSYDTPSASSAKDRPTRLARLLSYVVIPGLTLRRAWLISHLVFASCMFSTLVVRSIGGATAIIGIVGVSWALTLWAPFAIISAEVSKLEELRRVRGVPADGTTDQAGVILGIHNMSVAAPQILATIGSSIIFKFLQKPRGVPGDHSMSVVLACGGIFTLVAAYLTSRIKDQIELPEGMRAEEGEAGSRRAHAGSRRSSEAGLVSNERIGGLEY